MTPWLLSIAGIVIIGALVEIVLTDSPMSKFIRGIFGFFVLLVIVQPLPGMLKGAQQVGGNIQLNTELMQTINNQTVVAYQKNCETALATAGFKDVIVTIVHDKNAAGFKINEIYVTGNGISIKDEVVKIVCAVCNVDEGRVYYVG